MTRTTPDATPDADLAWLLSDPRGRRIVYRLLLSCGFFNACKDLAFLPFHEGRRSVATEFVGSILCAGGADLALLLTENQAEQPKRDRSGRSPSPSARRKRAVAVRKHGDHWRDDDAEPADGSGDASGGAGAG